MAQAYYRKWRPLDWDAVVGQDHIIRTLKNAMAKNRIAHAYLFSGPRGTGKTSTARIIAKAVNCLAEEEGKRPCNSCDHCEAINKGRFLDLIEIDAASNTSVDDIRSLREKINFAPTQGRYKVYIIDEVHMLSNAAFNALLKTLEEPPPHAIFVLATTEVHKIPATVLSRCQRHEFRRIPINFIQASLKTIAKEEGIEIDSAALTAIARQATGSMRDAVSLLDQLASTGSEVTLALTKDVLGTASSESVVSLIESILDKDAGSGIATIVQALDNGSDPRQFGRQVVDYLRSILMVKMGNIKQLEIEPEEQEKLEHFANRFEVRKLLDALQAFDRSSQSNNAGWQPGLQLELAVTQLACDGTLPDEETSPSKEVERVSQSVRPEIGQGKPLVNAETVSDQVKQKTPEKIEANHEGAATKETKQKSEKNGDGNAIQSQWKEIRAKAKSISPETAALLNSCKSVNLHRGKLELGFLSPILQSKMENGHNIDHAKHAIKQVCGIDIEILCVVAGKERSQVPADIEVDHEGMLGAALSLGGKMTKEDK
ncbi:MAG: DNA polymerase III subunit gamma/tau [Pelolinea sp.]|nr:DNA polymerase III subunit gamma/tau [Pelolinea sp.]